MNRDLRTLTHDPLALRVGIPRLEGVGFRLVLIIPALEDELQAARVHVRHLLVLLPDGALDVGEYLTSHAGGEALVAPAGRADQRGDPGHDVEVVHQVGHVLRQVLGLGRVRHRRRRGRGRRRRRRRGRPGGRGDGGRVGGGSPAEGRPLAHGAESAPAAGGRQHAGERPARSSVWKKVGQK